MSELLNYEYLENPRNNVRREVFRNDMNEIAPDGLALHLSREGLSSVEEGHRRALESQKQMEEMARQELEYREPTPGELIAQNGAMVVELRNQMYRQDDYDLAA